MPFVDKERRKCNFSVGSLETFKSWTCLSYHGDVLKTILNIHAHIA